MKRTKAIAMMLIIALAVTILVGAFNVLRPSMGVIPGTQPGEPTSLHDLVEYPEIPGDTTIEDVTDPFDRQGMIDFIMATPDYGNVSDSLAKKGYTFDLTADAEVSLVMSVTLASSGPLLSCWSTEVGPNGTRAFIAAFFVSLDEGMVVGGITNLLPPDQVPGVDPYIIVNAMPYLYIRWYWYAWPRPGVDVVGKVVSWYYWWYDSHSHPNWYWGCYWWWRTYIAYHWEVPGDPDRSWRPWWGWFWHWTYWRHWYWWSTYFPY